MVNNLKSIARKLSITGKAYSHGEMVRSAILFSENYTQGWSPY